MGSSTRHTGSRASPLGRLVGGGRRRGPAALAPRRRLARAGQAGSVRRARGRARAHDRLATRRHLGLPAWPAWSEVGTTAFVPRSKVAAVSRASGLLDLYAVGNRWPHPDDGLAPGRGLGPGESGGSARRRRQPRGLVPSAPYRAPPDIARHLRPGHERGRLHGRLEPGDDLFRGWWRIGELVCGTTNPRPSKWSHVGNAFWIENTAWSEEAQGITTDGEFWYLASNGNKTVRKYKGKAFQAGAFVPVQLSLSLVEGLAIEYASRRGARFTTGGSCTFRCRTPGVFGASTRRRLARTNGTRRYYRRPPPVVYRESTQWSLYTSLYEPAQAVLYAYDRDTMERVPEDDIRLPPNPSSSRKPVLADTDPGGVFTHKGRVILVCGKDVPNRLWCFSALTGSATGRSPWATTGTRVRGGRPSRYAAGNSTSSVRTSTCWSSTTTTRKGTR